jgi:hypothetical protein
MPLDIKTEKIFEKIRRQIVQTDKRQRRMLQCIELAIERITTDASVAELAKRHHLSQEKVRRYIDRAVLMARSRMFERWRGWDYADKNSEILEQRLWK